MVGLEFGRQSGGGLRVKGFEAILTISGGINDFFGGLPGKIMGVVAAIVAMRVPGGVWL